MLTWRIWWAPNNANGRRGLNSAFKGLNRLCWLGHVQGMEENRIPKRVLYMYLEATRLRGRPRNRWQDLVREDGRIVGGEGWQGKVHNREEWKKLLRTVRNRCILHMLMEWMNEKCFTLKMKALRRFETSVAVNFKQRVVLFAPPLFFFLTFYSSLSYLFLLSYVILSSSCLFIFSFFLLLPLILHSFIVSFACVLICQRF